MVKFYFEFPEFEGRFLQILQMAYNQGADVGECLCTAKRIRDGDLDSWCDEWVHLADLVSEDAAESENQGHTISACEAYLRASHYYLSATCFLYANPDDPRLTHAFDRHTEAFQKAAAHFSHPAEPLSIPFESHSLRACLFKPDSKNLPRPTVIINSGYDSTYQEEYIHYAKRLLQRGYNVLTFDGPGQGSALLKQGLSMRPDWHAVIGSLIDAINAREDVDNERIALIGSEWGGMLAALAASEERRPAALILHPGHWDALENLSRYHPDITALLDQGDSQELTTSVAKMLQNEGIALRFRKKMFIHGKESAIELIRACRAYALKERAPLIKCPTLVVENENELVNSGESKKLYEALTCEKQALSIPVDRGMGDHVAMGPIALVHQKAFDWLDTIVRPQEVLLHRP